MRKVLAICDHSGVPPSLDADGLERLPINPDQPNRNLRLEVENVSHVLLQDLDDVARDLLDIAAYVYYADTSITRGTTKDVFDKQWVRHFIFIIPVRKLEVWRNDFVTETLVEILNYLTQDKFDFTFVQRKPRHEQLAFRTIAEALPYHADADCVMLFSGGMDSLAGAVHLCANGRKPILASHRPRPVLTRLQRSLADSIRQRLLSWSFPHLDIRINRIGSEARDNSQRSRSFLFLALGSLVAVELGLDEVMVCENGITTFNLPRLGQTVGTQASRSTHPKFIRLFEELALQVFKTNLRISNPFLWMTRAEVIDVLQRNGVAELLPLSASCNQSRRPKIYPHCGTCSQCVDRRFAVAYAGSNLLESEINGYEKDIFTQSLEQGEEMMQAMSPVQFSLDIRQRDIDSFCEKYGQVYDAVGSIQGDPEKVLRDIYNLHRRFANEVHEVMRREHGINWERKYRRNLPDTCLLMLTGSDSPRLPDAVISQRAQELIQRLRECPVSKSKPLEDACEEVFSFLFCEDLPPQRALKRPAAQSETDQAYERRDLLFENRATEGFWAEARNEYNAAGVIVDAKNYKDEIHGDTVRGFAAKYIKDYGAGRLGVILARRVPAETRSIVSRDERVPSGIEEQKNQWRDSPHKMIVLLGEDDLVEMLTKKASGKDPTDVLRDRIFTLRSRI